MNGLGQDSAMTEIALALAMAFFAILVLTMVSMGSGSSVSVPEETASSLTVNGLMKVRPHEPVGNASGAAGLAVDAASLIVFDGRTIRDHQLQELAGTTLKAFVRSRRKAIILGVLPDIPLGAVLAVQRRLQADTPSIDIIVTPLPDNWISSLERIRQ